MPDDAALIRPTYRMARRPDKVLAPPSGNIVMPDGDAIASYQAYGLCKRKLTDLPIP